MTLAKEEANKNTKQKPLSLNDSEVPTSAPIMYRAKANASRKRNTLVLGASNCLSSTTQQHASSSVDSERTLRPSVGTGLVSLRLFFTKTRVVKLRLRSPLSGTANCFTRMFKFFFCCIAELAIKPCRSSRSKLRGEFGIPKHLQNRKQKHHKATNTPKPKTQHKTKRARQVFGM